MRRRIPLLLMLAIFTVGLQAQPCEEIGLQVITMSGNAPAVSYDSALLLPSILALQYYPELEETSIEFRRKKIGTLMAARPKLNFIFRKRAKREYVIFINTLPGNECNHLLKDMTVCAKTGIIGHEYAHILTYEEMSNGRLLLFACTYLFRKKKIERETDLIAVERGLGDQIMDFNRHIFRSEHASKKYLRKKQRNYLSIAEIEMLLIGSF